tara:strand:- start:699 stop:995 length:297 start_codon:yes stop_codon:yes gene_type:complete
MSEDQNTNQAPSQQQPGNDPVHVTLASSAVMTVGDYMVTMLLGYITCGIMFLVWAFSSSTNQNKANFAKAILIFYLITIVLYVIFFMFLGIGAMAAGF